MNQAPTTQFTVSRERFEKVPYRRMLYVPLYAGAFLLWMVYVIAGLRIASEAAPDTEIPGQIDPAAAEGPGVSDRVVVDAEASPVEIEFPVWMDRLRWVIGAMLLAFYVPFVSVLRTMGYPPYLIAIACLFVFLPIPGLFALAYLDTRIAKAWTSAADRLDQAETAQAAADSRN